MFELVPQSVSPLSYSPVSSLTHYFLLVYTPYLVQFLCLVPFVLWLWYWTAYVWIYLLVLLNLILETLPSSLLSFLQPFCERTIGDCLHQCGTDGEPQRGYNIYTARRKISVGVCGEAGLDYKIRFLMPWRNSCLMLGKYISFALWVEGSSFEVGEAKRRSRCQHGVPLAIHHLRGWGARADCRLNDPTYARHGFHAWVNAHNGARAVSCVHSAGKAWGLCWPGVWVGHYIRAGGNFSGAGLREMSYPVGNEGSDSHHTHPL